MPDFDTDRLDQLVRCKHAVLTQLRDLARKQLKLADKQDAAPMLSLLAVKQQLLDQLVGIEAALDPFRSQDPQQRRWRSDEARARCAETSQQCQTLLQEVMDLDRRGAEVLRARQAQHKAKIDSAHQAANAHTAYTAHNRPAAQQIDISSQT